MPSFLRGVIYVDGTVNIISETDLGGPNGDLTLVIAGDLIVNAAVSNVHDLTSIGGRRRAGLVIFGSPLRGFAAPACRGADYVNGSGRFVACSGRWVGDGLLYTQNGLIVGADAALDQIGALYNNGDISNTDPSFALRGGTAIVRYDPLALSALGEGFSQVSWQQLK